jgi:hypothetical protein
MDDAIRRLDEIGRLLDRIATRLGTPEEQKPAGVRENLASARERLKEVDARLRAMTERR